MYIETTAGGEDHAPSIDYSSMSLRCLFRQIVDHADRRALEEFHQHRPVFRLPGQSPLLFAPFVQAAFSCAATDGRPYIPAHLRDRTYDRTIDKFLLLPVRPTHSPGDVSETAGVDCRHYFAMLSRTIELWASQHPGADELVIEAVAARLIQRHVVRHCWLSALEERRRSRSDRSRYAWKHTSGTISVWMPCWLERAQRRPWLEAHVPAPDATLPDEKQRVQAIVDAYFGCSCSIPFDEQTHTPAERLDTPAGLDAVLEHAVSVHGLAAFVANEKALHLSELRPAVQQLGVNGLSALVHRVFDELAVGSLQDHVVAAAFGLSTATYSRVAGSHWQQDGRRPPDLWLNLARVCACFGPFRDVARATGAWASIERIVQTHGGWK